MECKCKICWAINVFNHNWVLESASTIFLQICLSFFTSFYNNSYCRNWRFTSTQVYFFPFCPSIGFLPLRVLFLPWTSLNKMYDKWLLIYFLHLCIMRAWESLCNYFYLLICRILWVNTLHFVGWLYLVICSNNIKAVS